MQRRWKWIDRWTGWRSAKTTRMDWYMVHTDWIITKGPFKRLKYGWKVKNPLKWVGEVQRWPHESWTYGWRSVKMGKMSEYRMENNKDAHMNYQNMDGKLQRMWKWIDRWTVSVGKVQTWPHQRWEIWIEKCKDDKNGWIYGSHRLQKHKKQTFED